jgi:hypothetical protein
MIAALLIDMMPDSSTGFKHKMITAKDYIQFIAGADKLNITERL